MTAALPSRTWLAAAALLALWCRIVVPQGMMLAPLPTGEWRMVICTGAGPVTVKSDLPGSEDKAPAGKAESPCAFAGLTAPATTPALLALPVVLTTAVVAALPALTIAVGRGLAAPPPPSTGPPLHS